MIDLLTLEPVKIAKSLANKYILLYAEPKAGKTSFAAQMPKNLILAFEIGYRALNDIHAVPVPNWMEFKQALRQLRNPKMREKFDTITIDTIAIAATECEKYICAQNNVDELGDIPYGKGYTLFKREIADTLKEITMLGYGLILIAHEKRYSTEFVTEDGTTIEGVRPDLNNSVRNIINGLCDLIAYIKVDFVDKKPVRTLLTRSTPTVFAGSRWQYLPPSIPFSYQSLVDAIDAAVQEQANHDGTEVAERFIEPSDGVKRPFDETMKEAREIWEQLTKKGQQMPQDDGAEFAQARRQIVEDIFGAPMKLSQANERQQALVEAAIGELRQLL